jgi:hypothetical protein
MPFRRVGRPRGRCSSACPGAVLPIRGVDAAVRAGLVSGLPVDLRRGDPLEKPVGKLNARGPWAAHAAPSVPGRALRRELLPRVSLAPAPGAGAPVLGVRRARRP